MRVPFDWLADPKTRGGGWARIRTAVVRGYLDGPQWEQRRRDLVAALSGLVSDPDLTPREVVALGRILAEMSLGDAERRLGRPPRKSQRRRGRRIKSRGPADAAGSTEPLPR